MGLEIVRVAIGMRTISAIFMESSILPEDQETIQQIAAILTGQHELSDTLLEDAKPGTTAWLFRVIIALVFGLSKHGLEPNSHKPCPPAKVLETAIGAW